MFTKTTAIFRIAHARNCYLEQVPGLRAVANKVGDERMEDCFGFASKFWATLTREAFLFLGGKAYMIGCLGCLRDLCREIILSRDTSSTSLSGWDVRRLPLPRRLLTQDRHPPALHLGSKCWDGRGDGSMPGIWLNNLQAPDMTSSRIPSRSLKG